MCERIVINPGHHERYDIGAPGPDGLTEAWVNTQVARRLYGYGGYELKRQGETGVGIVIAALKINKPDILVSLHCNGYHWKPGHCIHECHVYYWKDDLDVYRREASEKLATLLAEKAQGAFAERGEVHTFPLLRGDSGKLFTPGVMKNTAKRAAVLVELGFVADPHVAAQMKTESWQARAAAALDGAMQEFVK